MIRQLCKRVVLASICLAGLASTAFAQDDGEKAAFALVDRAITAVGGQDRLEKVQGATAQVSSNFLDFTGGKLGMKFGISLKGCDHYRLDLQSIGEGTTLSGAILGNNMKGGIKELNEGEKNTLTNLKDALIEAGMSHHVYAVQLVTFLPLLKTRDYKLTVVGEDKVGDRPALVFRVSQAERPDVNVFLDKESALPLKCAVRVRGQKTDQETAHELLFSEHKESDGLKYFTKILINRDERPLFETELSDIRFQENVDDSLFVATQNKKAPLKVCLVSGALEYDSDASLAVLQKYLEKNYDVKCTRAFRKADNDVPGLENLDTCDVMVLFTRRLTIDGEQLERVKKYCLAGKPIVGIRTASHAFQKWLDLDKEVLGGNYKNHYPVGPDCKIAYTAKGKDHPILAGVKFVQSKGSLYKNTGLAADCEVLLSGSIPDHTEPIAWARPYKGGRIFYTSLGHQEDFTDENFLHMIANALYWTAQRTADKR